MAEPADQDPVLLAGEYVLGTLSGEQRRDFERRLVADSQLRAEVHAWEQRLVALDDTAAKPPPARVWASIERALDARAARRSPSWWRSPFSWAGLAVTAALAFLVVALWPLLPFQPAVEAPAYSLVMQAQGQPPQWRIAVDWDERSLLAERLAADRLTDRDYELWLLPRQEGVAPVSLGVLRGDRIEAELPERLSADQASAFAVSLEPRGGSATGAPTGPVLYLAEAPRKKV